MKNKENPALSSPRSPVPTPLSRALGLRGRVILFASWSTLGVAPGITWAQSSCVLSSSSTVTCSLPAGSVDQAFSYIDSTHSIIASSDTDFTINESADSGGLSILSQANSGNSDNTAGSSGSSVSLTNNGTVTLSGTASTQVSAVLAASQGGDGATPDDHDNGGNGGNGGAVTLTNQSGANVAVSAGNFAGGVIGINAFSRGGNGALDNSALLDNYGGNGGNTGAVVLKNYGTVTLGSSGAALTGGTRAWGVAAQAIGGAGGNDASSAHSDGAQGQGGSAGSSNNQTNPDVALTTVGDVSVYWSSAGSSTATDSVAAAVALSQGGDGGIVSWTQDVGGSGGMGGYVDVAVGDGTTATTLTVNADQASSGASAGVLALSLGGNGGQIGTDDGTGGVGGNAGDVDVNLQYATVATQGDGVAGVWSRSRGGDGGGTYPPAGTMDGTHGGNGGKGGNASVSLMAADNLQTIVTTSGAASYGILAQSIGGFGGTAKDSGGFGEDAGTASALMGQTSFVTTTGDYAAGVVAQSIGGGGGTGSDFALGLAGSGGNGGNGGSGTDVQVEIDGSVTTQGAHAYGALGQSIGGSGGTGGIEGAVIALGGDGGAGGGAGTVTMKGIGGIQTAGYSAIGMLAQSIGGGGGAAGSADGVFSIGGSVSNSDNNSGGTVDLSFQGVLKTTGEAAIGMLGQSIGGGGGSGGSAVGVGAIGGSGSSGGDGGNVTVTANSALTTSGLYAHGVVAQSVGGGGGNGGSAFGVSPGVASVPTVGGSAGKASAGGTVTLNASSRVATQGDGANALLAQSIGGGGGSGGSATQTTFDSEFSLAIGGAGTGGGHGGQVTVATQSAQLTTQGTAAGAIVAQSVGGGGGNGGAAHSNDVNVGFSSAMSLGGSAGGGGDGGQVAVNLTDTLIGTAGLDPTALPSGQTGIALSSSDSIGILAQSIGGGGGNGGSSASNSLTIPLPTEDGSFSVAANFALGGKAGGGGTGGEVDITLAGQTNIYTAGQGAHAVLAQSIGGGGGNGGGSKAMSTTVASTEDSLNVKLDVAVGGAGGDGGDGGNVNLKLDSIAVGSRIVSYDDLSNGLMAQSIGGGGGNAGVGSSSSGGKAAGQSVNVTIGVGGIDGGGGNGGVLTGSLPDGSTVQTFGSGSRGVLMQSIGGGGGTAQGSTIGLSGSYSGGGGDDDATVGDDDDSSFTATVGVSVGGTGGQGGSGGAVTLTAIGAIETSGGDADGILLQSIGGGGGLAGSAGSDASAGSTGTSSSQAQDDSDDDSASYSLSVGVGGTGGLGGDGGDMTLNYGGWTTTQGDYADAIVLQSIGGGGGVGGTSTVKGADGTAAVNIAVGGSGGAAGDGGNVTLNMVGNDLGSHAVAITNGDVAYGLLAQSIGGGGGQGADGSVNLSKSTQDTPSVSLGLSGSGGNGGSAGTITMNADNSIFWASTAGFNSHAVLLQAIGGGGGTASLSSATLNSGEGGPALKISLGGGGSGQDVDHFTGGDINVDTWLSATTTGEHAFGLVAQAIGGGGGIVATGAASNVESIALQRSGVGGGGNIDVTLNTMPNNAPGAQQSTITTSGRGSHGIVLQSIGGGGGIAGYTANGALSTGWQGGATGTSSSHGQYAGYVNLTLDGVVRTTGDGAHGIVVQSIADGGGLGGTSTGSFAGSVYDHSQGGGGLAGDIKIQQSGTVSATGNDAFAIFAQSDGNKDGPASVAIDINGHVTGGSGTGVGIWIDGTATSNTVFVNSGASVQAGSGKAIRQTGTGSAIVHSYGSVAGSLSLSDVGVALGSFTNFGTLLRADNINGNVINHGDVHIGRNSGSDRTHVTGDFTQTDAGTLHVGADFVARTADLLQVDGDANLAGEVKVVGSRLMPGRQLTFLKADRITSGATAKGASSLFDFDTTYSDKHGTIEVGKTAHFDDVSQAYGVARNPKAVAMHLQDIWARGGSEELAGLYAALDQTAALSGNAFADSLSNLSPGIAAAPAALKHADMTSFANSLLSCPRFQGSELRLKESSCTWGQVIARRTSLDGSHGTSGFDSDSVTYQVGVQYQIAPQWFAGVAVAYENSHIKDDSRRQSLRGDSAYLGGSLKYENGPWLMAGTLTASYGSFDSKRDIRLLGLSEQAKSSPDVMALGQRLRLAYTHAIDKAYIKPSVDLDLTYTRMAAYSEHGAGALNLRFKKSDSWTAILTPGIEIGGLFDLGNGYIARPYASVGVSLSSTDHWDSRARLVAAPSDSAQFESTLETGSVFGRVAAGVQLSSGDQLDLRVQYDGVFSDRARSHGGSLKGSWRF